MRAVTTGAFVLFLTASVLSVPMMSFAVLQGINDGESGYIENHGHFSVPDALEWGPWQRDDGKVYPVFARYSLESDSIMDYRKGVAHGWVFDYTIYECRDVKEPDRVVPAVGPDSGATYHWEWTFAMFGITGLIGVCMVRSRRAKSPS